MRLWGQVDTSKPKYYVLDMFPYPSGAGLHVGHPEGYTATDILARYKRMRGCNVLHPMGWDAFGLPAEQYALQTGTHPAETTAKNVDRFREQLKALGFSYDWQRELSTTDVKYYKWTQWIFLQLFERGLAYQAEVAVNWCPALGTVLANEEVIDGLSERGGHPVVRRPMRQWMLKITAYADRLLEDLDELDWPESIKDMQRNWIGRSEGAQLAFGVTTADGEEAALDVYTTRPDTLFGATYCVVAPEHPLAARLATDEQRVAVEEYIETASRKSDRERTENKTKTGVFTGAMATNPATGEGVPVWVADYVLGSYGTGAIMAVPAHDARDLEFARAMDIAVKEVVRPADANENYESPAEGGEAFGGAGVMVNSANAEVSLDGKSTAEAREAMLEWLEASGKGERKVQYKLRDWLFSRQRYWGEPFPIVFVDGDTNTPVALSADDLPLELPPTENYKPSAEGEPPLSTVSEWVNTTDPSGSGKPAVRETNTMPQWAGSCWYYLRFVDPDNVGAPIDPEKEKYWMPVDMYVGGAEHAVLHLLYARFWHKVLYDCGVVSTKEPFRRLVSQGMILGEVEYTAYRESESGEWVPPARAGDEGVEAVSVSAEEVQKKGNGYTLVAAPGVGVDSRAHKMSKSRGNVINPDDIVAEYGADSLRLYEMFMGPLTDTKVWNTRDIEGVHRFLAKCWRLFEGGLDDSEPTEEQLRELHRCIKKVGEDTEAMRFNTAISAMMEFVNAAQKWDTRPKEALRVLPLLLASYAPHIAEDLWAQAGEGESLAYEPWPEVDESLLVASTFTLPVQVLGKTKGTVEVPADCDQEGAMAAVMDDEKLGAMLEGKDIKKVIWVPGKIINLIIPKKK